MAICFAKLDSSNKVTKVHTIPQEWDDGTDVKGQNYLRKLYWDSTVVYKRTDTRMQAGVHRDDETPYRKNFAGKGMTYDSVKDAFIHQQPFPSWILNEDICDYEPPIPYPDDGRVYDWKESEKKWDPRYPL